MTPQQKLEELRSLQIEERKFVDALERRGATGRVVNYLHDSIGSRETEIVELEAALGNDSGPLRQRTPRQVEQQNDAA
jgi:hypothetical protein